MHRYLSLDTIDLIQPGGKNPEPKTESIAMAEREHENMTYNLAVEDLERKLFLSALQKYDGNKDKTAGSIDLPLRTFYRKLKKLGLDDIDIP